MWVRAVGVGFGGIGEALGQVSEVWYRCLFAAVLTFCGST